MSSIVPTATYSNTTISSASSSSGSGLTYNTGTSVNNGTWGSTSFGTISGKDFILDGVSLKELIEQRLAWLVPNPELEQEWDELKALGDAYRKLEAECKEKSRMWKTLKKTG